MTRITITVPDDLAALVTHEARRLSLPVSEVVRRAIKTALGISEDAQKRILFAALGRSGERHVARDAEEILAQEWSSDRGR